MRSGRSVQVFCERVPIDGEITCLMHSRTREKDSSAFVQTLQVLLNDEARELNFSGFCFPEGTTSMFRYLHLGRTVRFDKAEFWGDVVFEKVEFQRLVRFDDASFNGSAIFLHVQFNAGAVFSRATFFQAARFLNLDIGPVGDKHDDSCLHLEDVDLRVPELTVFRSINQARSAGVWFSVENCDIERVRFEEVNWRRQDNRIVLYHETFMPGIWTPGIARASFKYHLLTLEYIRLMKSLERNGDSDLAEDVFCSVMELRRLDSRALPFASRLAWAYDSFEVLARFASLFTLAGLYRIVSLYGSNYRRAFIVLVLLILGFGVAYAVFAELIVHEIARNHGDGSVVGAGILYSLEVATFQRETTAQVTTLAGRILRLVESVVVPAQVAILLLAVRRRFRR